MPTISLDFGTTQTGTSYNSIPGLTQSTVKINYPTSGFGVVLNPNTMGGILCSRDYVTGAGNNVGINATDTGTQSGILLVDEFTDFAGFSKTTNKCLKLSLNISLPSSTTNSTSNAFSINMGKESGLIGFLITKTQYSASELILAGRNSNGKIQFHWCSVNFTPDTAPVYTYINSTSEATYVDFGKFEVYRTNGILSIYYNEELVGTLRDSTNLIDSVDSTLAFVGIFGEQGTNGWLYCDNFYATDTLTFPSITEQILGELSNDLTVDTSINLSGYFTPDTISAFSSPVNGDGTTPFISNKGLDSGDYLSLWKVPFTFTNSMLSIYNVYLNPTGTVNDSVGIIYMAQPDLSYYILGKMYYKSDNATGEKVVLEITQRSEADPPVVKNIIQTLTYNEAIFQTSGDYIYASLAINSFLNPTTNKLSLKITVHGLSTSYRVFESGGDYDELDENFNPGLYMGVYVGSSGTGKTVKILPSSLECASLSYEEPSTPSITYTTPTTFSVAFNSNTFSDIDGGTHKATEWQVTNLADTTFSSPIHDVVSTTNLTSITLDNFEKSTTYLARVRYQDESNNWSEWSETIDFTTNNYQVSEIGNYLVWPATIPPPSDSSKQTIQFRTKITPFENGSESRQTVVGYERVLWSLTWSVLTNAQFELIKEFFRTCNGQAYSFIWTEPLTNQTYNMRFASDTLTRELFNAHLSNVTIDLIQVIS